MFSHMYEQSDEDTGQAFAMLEDHPFPLFAIYCASESLCWPTKAGFLFFFPVQSSPATPIACRMWCTERFRDNSLYYKSVYFALKYFI